MLGLGYMEKQYPEILLVRLEKKQKVFIRKMAKIDKVSEAAFVRYCIDFYKVMNTL